MLVFFINLNLLFFLKIFFCLFLFCVYGCLSPYVTYIQYLRRLERAVNLLEMELQTVMSCHLANGNATWKFCKNSKCS